jgi:predicted nucleotide-binding protein
MKNILILEDDPFLSQSICDTIIDIGAKCKICSTINDFEKVFSKNEPDGLIVDLQIPINGNRFITNNESHAGYLSGQAVLRKAKLRWQKTSMALMTGKPSEPIRNWCLSNDIEYFIKPIERSTFERFVGARNIRAFIVHGHNMTALESVKSALRALHIDPVVLMNCANLGRTVIEKFEEVSNSCDCAIVILSPDDIGRLKISHLKSEQFRTRQNVIFELGYFYGALGRRSGIVMLIEYGKVDIPSDIAGIVRLNGKLNPLELKNNLKQELDHILIKT